MKNSDCWPNGCQAAAACRRPKARTPPEPEHYDRRIEIDGRQVYQYFQPMYATSEYCVNCHKALGEVPNSKLQDGDLMAVIRVTLDDRGNGQRAGDQSGAGLDGGDRDRLFVDDSRCGPSCAT